MKKYFLIAAILFCGNMLYTANADEIDDIKVDYLPGRYISTAERVFNISNNITYIRTGNDPTATYVTLSNKKIYRVPYSIEFSDTPFIEAGAYVDTLRYLDVINGGKKERFTDPNTYRLYGTSYDNIPITPISNAGVVDSDKIHNIFDKTENIVTDKINYIDLINSNTSSVSHENPIRLGYNKRVFFGNKNKIKDFIIVDEETPEISKDRIKYKIDGKYAKIFPIEASKKKLRGEKINPLELTIDEYKSKIEGKKKNDNEMLVFLKDKLKNHGLEVFIEDGQLWNRDSEGKKHQVLWSFEPVSVINEDTFRDETAKDRYQNTILTNIYTYVKTPGTVTATNDGSLIIKEIVPKETFTVKVVPDSLVDTEYDWYYGNKTKKYNNNVLLTELLFTLESNPNFKTLEDLNINSSQIKDIFTQYLNDKKNLLESDFNKKWEVINNIITYFNDKKNLSESDFNKKWENIKIDTSELTYGIRGTTLEFRGGGIVDGTVDLGTGVNQLTITQQLTGKYGSNIVFTPNANLKNIDLLIAGNQGGVDVGAVGLSGKASMSVQVDPNITNKNNRLYKHVLNNTWTKDNKIFITDFGSSNDSVRNLYIELQTSQISTDKEIEIGRPLIYDGITTLDMTKPLKEHRITLVSDSIAHRIEDIENEKGKNAIVKVHIKENLKRLTNSENEIYRNIVKTKEIAAIAPTLTSSIKRTQFSYDEGNLRKIYKNNILRDIYKDVDAEKIIENNSHFLVDNTQKNKLIDEIKILKDSEETKKIINSLNILEKIKEKNLNLNQINNMFELVNRISFNSTKYSKTINEDTQKWTKAIKNYKAEHDKILKEKTKEFNEEITKLDLNSLEKEQLTKKFNEHLDEFLNKVYYKSGFTSYDWENPNDNWRLSVDLKIEGIDAKKLVKELNRGNEEAVKNEINKRVLAYYENLKGNGGIINSVINDNQETKEEIRKELSKKKDYIKNTIDTLKKLAPISNDKNLTETNLYKKIKEVEKELNTVQKFINGDNSISVSTLLSALYQLRTSKIPELNKVADKNEIEKAYFTSAYLDNHFEYLIANMLYTQREEESLRELKTLISQIKEKNIYAEVNKISKNEIDVFTPLAFNNPFNSEKPAATGGALSGRFSKGKFKGNIYTAYGIYELPTSEKNSVGFVVGGGSSDHKEIKNDTLKDVTTESKIAGTRAYVGAFDRYNYTPNISFVAGIGTQYGKYKVDRDFRNNYQRETYKGKLNTLSTNVYTGVTYKYKINDTLDLNTRAVLSYTYINQGKATEEKKPLSMEVKKQNFNYLDGEVGVNLTKTVYSSDAVSSVSGGVYGIYGLAGYNNKDLTGNFDGSSSFAIKGNKYRKDSIKVQLEYNVSRPNGLNYGLEGSYTTNANEDNISIGVKAGYKF